MPSDFLQKKGQTTGGQGGSGVATQGFTYRSGLRVEYILWTSGRSLDSYGVFILPGFLSGARAGERLARRLEAEEGRGLSPILAVSLSLRGRGNSAFGEEAGYSIAHHIRDIEAVRSELGLREIAMCAFSASVPYAISYALEHPHQVRALILGDYPPKFRKIPDSWVNDIEAEPWLFPNWDAALAWAVTTWSVSPQDFEHAKHEFFLELPSGEVRRSYARGLPRRLQAETTAIDFTGRLHEIRCPVLILRGILEGSLLPQHEAVVYQEECNAKVVEIPSGHDVFEHPLAMRTINEFLSSNFRYALA